MLGRIFWLSLPLVLGFVVCAGAAEKSAVAEALAREVAGPRQAFLDVQTHVLEKLPLMQKVASAAQWEIIRLNVNRLKQVRQQTFNDLISTLAWVRELVSMIHLAKFTVAPASRAEELVAQIAAAVEGLSAIAWHQEDFTEAG